MQDFIDIMIRIMADGLVVPIVLWAGWVLMRIPRGSRFVRLARGVMLGLVALWLAKILSLLYQEGERPFVLLGVHPGAAYLSNPGFPSDHVLFVFCITAVVWASTKNLKVSASLLLLSCLVGVGRVAALVHTPVDVAGGVFCVAIAATIVYGASFFKRALPDQDNF